MPIALVTGANSGIGRATAIGLAGGGVHVIAAGRSAERAQPVLDEIAAFGGSAEFLELDLASMTSVRTASQSFADTRRNLDILVNNAGIGVNRRGLTEDGFEVHFGINHLGHFLLTRELFPNLGPESRVVALTSAMHFRADGIDFARVRRPTAFTGLAEYATSKLANVLFTRELARRRPEIRAYAVHPGLVRTRLIPGPIRVLSGLEHGQPRTGRRHGALVRHLGGCGLGERAVLPAANPPSPLGSSPGRRPGQRALGAIGGVVRIGGRDMSDRRDQTLMHIDVNGTRLWFDVDGPALVPDGNEMRQRPTMVLVHGGPGIYDHSYFKPDFGRLAEHAQVVYLDLRGHGRSDWGDAGAWSFEACADDVRASVTRLG